MIRSLATLAFRAPVDGVGGTSAATDGAATDGTTDPATTQPDDGSFQATLAQAAATIEGPAAANGRGTPLNDAENSSYPRMIRLENAVDDQGQSLKGALLATASVQPGPDTLPDKNVVYRADPGSASFQKLNDVATANGSNYAATSTLYELPQDMGGQKAGTVLLGVRSGGAGDGTPGQIDVYASHDGGAKFDYLSTAPLRGLSGTSDDGSGGPNLWEPEFSADAAGNLNLFFSDETKSQGDYNQAIEHVTSADGGATWGDKVTVDVGNADDPGYRPGMARVAKSPDGPYVMAFENGGGGPGQDFTLHVKTSTDGDHWIDPAHPDDPASPGAQVVSDKGSSFRSTADIAYTPADGGELIATAKQFLPGAGSTLNPDQAMFVTHDLTGQSGWMERSRPFAVPGASTPLPEGNGDYSPTLLPSEDGSSLQLISSADEGGGKTTVQVGGAPFTP